MTFLSFLIFDLTIDKNQYLLHMEKLLLVIPLFSYTVVMPQIQSDRLWIDWRDSIFKSLKRNAREEIMDIYQSNRLQVYASIPPSNRGLDGLTEVFLEGDIKTFKVFINPRVINSQFRCFRFAVILHEIMHVRTYNDESLHTKDQLDSEPKHGNDYSPDGGLDHPGLEHLGFITGVFTRGCHCH